MVVESFVTKLTLSCFLMKVPKLINLLKFINSNSTLDS